MICKVEISLQCWYSPTLDEWTCNADYFYEGNHILSHSWHDKSKNVVVFMAHVKWSALEARYGLPESALPRDNQPSLPGMDASDADSPF